MKTLVATLLLLFQLQPLLGSAACLFSSDRPSQQECEMPAQPKPAHDSVLPSGSLNQGCALAFVCARTPLAIPSLSDAPESMLPLPSAAATPVAVALTDVVSAPPFHPPRA
jgi:hypothetical protein